MRISVVLYNDYQNFELNLPKKKKKKQKKLMLIFDDNKQSIRSALGIGAVGVWSADGWCGEC